MLLPLRKTLVLLACTLMGLACGTLYLYSSYSPQLALHLGYSVTDSLSIALVGSFGVAISGPLAGYVVDRKGYTPALILGALTTSAGYFTLKAQFDSVNTNVQLLCLCILLVGMGLTFLNLACLKCCAVTFPKMRGVATSLPLALYGLSAMFYSVVASMFFPGDTLGFMGFVGGLILAICFVCLPVIMLCDRQRRTPPSSGGNPTHVPRNTSDLTGIGLLKSSLFWLLFALTGALAAIGQMYIYLVGYMVKALVTKTFHLSAEVVTQVAEIDALIQQQQQLQVSLLSFSNCVGRLMAGVLGDIVHQRFKKPRRVLLIIPSTGFALTQLMALTAEHHDSISVASVLTGFFYGFVFCTMPMIVADAFGVEYLTANWGWVALAPVAPSMYLTNFFGKVYDSRAVESVTGAKSCLLGHQCYDSTFAVTFVVAIFAIFIVIAINWTEGLRLLSSKLSEKPLSRVLDNEKAVGR